MLKHKGEKEKYFKAMLALAIPISIQSLFQASLSMIDQIMIGQLGEDVVAAVGLGSRFPFILLITLSAIASAASIFAAQFYGQKNMDGIAKAIGGTAIFGIIITIIFTITSLAFPQHILRIYTKDTPIIKMGSEYLKIVAIGYIPMLFIGIYSSVLRSIERVKIPMYTGLCSISVNTLLNYILIFGKFNAPRMGLCGAALATTLSRFIELGLILGIVYIKKYPIAFGVNKLFNISSDFMRKLFMIMWPLVINEFLWALGETLYSAIYGRIGTVQVAAMTLTYPVQSLSIGLFSGVSGAAAIMIGNSLGQKDNDTAFNYSKEYIKLGIIGSVVLGVLMIVFSGAYTSIYNVSPESKQYTVKLLIVFSSVLWIKVSNMIIGGAILRSGGETKYTLVLDMIGTWGIGIPMGLISAFVFKLPVYWVYFLISMEELVRLLIGLKLVYSKKWIKNIQNVSASNAIEV
ncbi:MATE family efflux transporter [Clostridium sp. ZS2-4]|uniref:MATE family efflux transporter n=1 Tax=Clostridium sp. ZS2-4 TaxID=2987703 RepID=UPI00227A7C2F|nr:MATE family efflux transporter [Clostridium sp. ZS2-4]MCY6356439.1 MATE family efflux transporter [Clostridium sp. ZS2-4]